MAKTNNAVLQFNGNTFDSLKEYIIFHGHRFSQNSKID